MKEELFLNYKSLLADAAHDFSRDADFPIQLSPLLKKLGVPVRQSDSDARLGSVRLRSNGDEVILISSGFLVDRAKWGIARFLISHELAHIVLRRHGICSPVRPSEYWEFEYLCDYFARILLIPERLVGTYHNGGERCPLRWLLLANELGRAAEVNWLTAVHRLADVCPSVRFLALRRPAGLERSYTVYSSTVMEQGINPIPKYLGRGAKISENSRLSRLLDEAEGNIAIRVGPEVVCEALPSIPEAKAIAAKPIRSGEQWRFAVVYHSSADDPAHVNADPR